MASIITNNLRRTNIEGFMSLFSSGDDSIYLFIGRPQLWPTNDNIAPAPVDNEVEFYDYWRDMIAMKRISAADMKMSIARRTWENGLVYDEYRHNYSGTNLSYSGASTLFESTFYVLNSEYRVYKCISNNGNSSSTVEPTGTSTNIFTTADSYKWKYMYALDTNSVLNFATPDFIPVLTDSNVVSTAIPGGVHEVRVTNPGAGYTTATAAIVGDGTGAVASVTLNSGGIQSITISNPGTNYTYASVVITGDGSAGAASVIISPVTGHGANPELELGAFNVTLNVTLPYSDGDFPVVNDYRRIGIIRNPFNFSTIVVSTAETLSSVYTMVLKSAPTPGNFLPDDLITGQTSGAKARILSYDSGTRVLRYSRTTSDRLLSSAVFQANELIQNEATESGEIATLTNPEVELYSGEILYIDHRKAISRALDQIEQINITLEF